MQKMWDLLPERWAWPSPGRPGPCQEPENKKIRSCPFQARRTSVGQCPEQDHSLKPGTDQDQICHF